MISVSSSEGLIFTAVIASAIATYLTRAVPFWLFKKDKKRGGWLLGVERYMGLMIMVLLIFYALKDTKFDVYPYGLSEIAGVLAAVLFHIKFNNALLSIVVSTAIYIVFIRNL
ncbi:AzlD domain-containing protein [Campylobacter sp. faydin G-24]|uniref:AzlD domain-containing protein n=1 Tax=Campylobacter anatolicus TaxID=2829105 RepID=A0ABS5HHF1_9BACT|nr:AzlD domain-containing protein [Campylobacter anatolicus]MBR8462182.1 AzlD domain-containing protein [Campylobacter anatolicus]MBR8463701.1 AzlD domain-containing protein [Campylobacter anatolicus]MBR8466387.1 AzlD domain-containing protein [Campylobacter anatolicus]